MEAGIFTITHVGSNFIPLERGKMVVVLSDFTEREHIAFATIPITKHMPQYIKCSNRWYGLSHSWNETLPDEEKPRDYYRKPVDFEPGDDAYVAVAEEFTVKSTTIQGVCKMIVTFLPSLRDLDWRLS